MRRPALTRLAVVPVAALSLALAAAAPGLADSTAEPSPSVSDDGTAGAPADPTAPVLDAEESNGDPTSTPEVDTPEGETPEAETPEAETPAAETPAVETPEAEVEADDEAADDEATGSGAYSYPFVLTAGEDGTSTVTIEVAGAGISLSYVLDEAGKVTEAAVADGDATLVRATPHTVRMVLASGETVTVKVHGDSVRVKVKPRKGGPLRPGITTEEQTEAEESGETEESAEDGDEAAKPTKPSKADKSSKPARVEKSQKAQKAEKSHKAKKSQKAGRDDA